MQTAVESFIGQELKKFRTGITRFIFLRNIFGVFLRAGKRTFCTITPAILKTLGLSQKKAKSMQICCTYAATQRPGGATGGICKFFLFSENILLLTPFSVCHVAWSARRNA